MKKDIQLGLAGVVLSFIGLTDSLYLVDTQVNNKPIICGFLEGCNTVAASPYSSVFGIHLSSLGALFYFLLLLLFLSVFFIRVRIVTVSILMLSSLGALSSLYFMYLQFFVINAQCVYCMISAGVSILLFGIAYTLDTHEKQTAPKVHPVIPPHST